MDKVLYIAIAVSAGGFFGFGVTNRYHLETRPDAWVDQAITFETLDTQCIGLDEVNGGRVWLCDNGHVEYDETRVKFPDVAPRTDE